MERVLADAPGPQSDKDPSRKPAQRFRTDRPPLSPKGAELCLEEMDLVA